MNKKKLDQNMSFEGASKKARLELTSTPTHPLHASDSQSFVENFRPPAQSTHHSLCNLNSDCLDKILSYLSLGNIINMAASHPYLQLAIEDLTYARRECLVLDHLRGLTPNDMKRFFQMFGHNFKIIRRASSIRLNMHIDIITNIRKYCPHVRVLELEMTHITTNQWRTLLSDRSLSSSVIELHVPQCNLQDGDMEILARLKQIEILDLTGNHQLTGKHLHKFTNVKELNLHYCTGIGAVSFKAIFGVLQERLRKLDVLHCRHFNAATLCVLVDKCVNLKALSVNCNAARGFERICYLRALQQLHIYAEDGAYEQVLSACAHYGRRQLQELQLTVNDAITPKAMSYVARYDQLEKLTIAENDTFDDACLEALSKGCAELQEIYLHRCRTISNKGVLQLIQCCPKLKSIGVVGCTGLKEEIIELAAERLKTQKRKEKIAEIGVNGTDE